jgi:hypothetical protein
LVELILKFKIKKKNLQVWRTYSEFGGPIRIITIFKSNFSAILLTIHLGSNTLQGTDLSRVTVATSEYVLHPEYNSDTLENDDIALINLRIAISYSGVVILTNFK